MKIEVNIDTSELIDEIARKVIERLEDSETNMSDGDLLLTLAELCEYLHVKESWVYQRTHAKTIPFHKAGNKLLFRKAEIDQYIAKGRKEPL